MNDIIEISNMALMIIVTGIAAWAGILAYKISKKEYILNEEREMPIIY